MEMTFNSMQINLTHAWREDWKSFLSSDDKKRHWINQRILEDERELVESEQPPIPKYVPEKKQKLTLIQIIQFPKQIIGQYLP